MDGRGVQRVGHLHLPRAGVRLRVRAARLGERLDQRRQGEADVGDDRVAHRRPHRLVGIGGDRDQARALRQQRPGDVRVVGEDRGADDEDQVVALERLADRADRGRQDAAEVRMVLGEAEAHAAGRGRGPDREVLALGEGDGVLPAPGGVDVGAGDEDRVPRRVELRREGRHRGRVGDGAAGHLAGDRVAGVGGVDLDAPSRPSAG